MSQYLGFHPINTSPYYFISYSSDDARRLTSFMQALSLEMPLWYDYGLSYGKDWSKEIADHIQNSEAVLLFMSKNVLAKGNASYVYTEYQMAKDFFNKKIYVIQIDEIANSDIPNELLGWWIELRRYQNIIKTKTTTFEDLINQIVKAAGLKNGSQNYCLQAEDGTVYNLRKGINTIGTDPRINTLTLHYGSVSRAHAVIEIEENRLPFIFDMLSMNGTYLNGNRLEAKTRYDLKPGNRLVFGNIPMLFTTEKAINALPKTTDVKQNTEPLTDQVPSSHIKKDDTSSVIHSNNVKQSKSPTNEFLIEQKKEWFVPGSEVEHIRFGKGVITHLDGPRATIYFANSVKTFDLNICLAQKSLKMIKRSSNVQKTNKTPSPDKPTPKAPQKKETNRWRINVDASEKEPFVPGAKVTHSMLGRGTIISRNGSIITVKFSNNTEESLDLDECLSTRCLWISILH